MISDLAIKQNAKYSKLYSAIEMQFCSYSNFMQPSEFQYVYQPHDDTYLILSTLKEQIKQFQSDLILCELGSGSGVISANVNSWLKNINKVPLIHVSIDINMDASTLSQKYYNHYNLNIQQINTSLFNNLIFEESKFSIKPNVIIFNPPYVPVEQEQIDNQQKYLVSKLKYVRQNRKCMKTKQQNLIAFSYMGGIDGLAITRKIIGRINWNCTLYFIVMGEEGLQTIRQQISTGSVLNQSTPLKALLEVMQYHQFYNEHLFVLKLIFKVEK